MIKKVFHPFFMVLKKPFGHFSRGPKGTSPVESMLLEFLFHHECTIVLCAKFVKPHQQNSIWVAVPPH